MVDALRGLGLAEFGSFANPLDLAAPFVEQFRDCIRLIDEAGVADIILPVFGDPIRGSAELMAELTADSKACLCAAYYGGGEVEKAERPAMHRAGVAVFPSPERAIRAIGMSCWYAEKLRTSEADQ